MLKIFIFVIDEIKESRPLSVRVVCVRKVGEFQRALDSQRDVYMKDVRRGQVCGWPKLSAEVDVDSLQDFALRKSVADTHGASVKGFQEKCQMSARLPSTSKIFMNKNFVALSAGGADRQRCLKSCELKTLSTNVPSLLLDAQAEYRQYSRVFNLWKNGLRSFTK